MEGENKCVRVINCDCPQTVKQTWFGCRKCTRVFTKFEELVSHKEVLHREILDPENPTRFISLDPEPELPELPEVKEVSETDSSSEAEQAIVDRKEKLIENVNNKKHKIRIRPRCSKCRKRFPHNMAYNKHMPTCQSSQSQESSDGSHVQSEKDGKTPLNATLTCPFCIKPISVKNLRRHTKNSHEKAIDTLTGIYEVKEPVTMALKKYLEATFVNSTFKYLFPTIESEKRKRVDSSSSSTTQKKTKTEYKFPPRTGIKKDGDENLQNSTDFWQFSQPSYSSACSSISNEVQSQSEYSNEYGYGVENFQQLHYPQLSQETELNMNTVEQFPSTDQQSFQQESQYFQSPEFQQEFKPEPGLMTNPSNNFLDQGPQSSQQNYQHPQQLTSLQAVQNDQLLQERQQYDNPQVPMTFYSAPMEDTYGQQYNENQRENYLHLNPNDQTPQTSILMNRLNEFECENVGMSLQDIGSIFDPSISRPTGEGQSEEKEENSVIVNQMEMEYLDLDIQKNNPIVGLQNDILFSSTIHPEMRRVKDEDEDCQILSESFLQTPPRNLLGVHSGNFDQNFFNVNNDPKLNGFKVSMKKDDVRELANLHGNSPNSIRLTVDLKSPSSNNSSPSRPKRINKETPTRVRKPKMIFTSEKDKLAYQQATSDLGIINLKLKEMNTPSNFTTLEGEQKRLEEIIAKLVKLNNSSNKSPNKSKRERIKKEEERVSCPKCNENLASAYGLSRHLKIHNNPSVFCDFCHQGFPSNAILVRHMFRTHEKQAGKEQLEAVRNSIITPKHARRELDRKCPLVFCFKVYSRPDTRNRHVLTHLKTGFIKCIVEECPAKSETVDAANLHHKWCSTKQYCFFCGMFLRWNLLFRHFSVLHKKLDLCCHICKNESKLPKEEFDSFVSLNEHMLENHNELRAKPRVVPVKKSESEGSLSSREEDEGAGYGIKKCSVKIIPLKPEDLIKYNNQMTKNEKEIDYNLIPTLVHVNHEDNEIKVEENEIGSESSENENSVETLRIDSSSKSPKMSESSMNEGSQKRKIIFSGQALRELSRDVKVKIDHALTKEEQEMTTETSSNDSQSGEDRQFGQEELIQLMAKEKEKYDQECVKSGNQHGVKRILGKFKPPKKRRSCPDLPRKEQVKNDKCEKSDESFHSALDASFASRSSTSENEVSGEEKEKSNDRPTSSSGVSEDEGDIEIIGEVKGSKKPPLPSLTPILPNNGIVGKGNVFVLIKTDPSGGVSPFTTSSLFLRLGENSDLRDSIVTTTHNLTSSSIVSPITSVIGHTVRGSVIQPNGMTRLIIRPNQFNQAIVRTNEEGASVQNLISPQFLIQRLPLNAPQREIKTFGNKNTRLMVSAEDPSESEPSSPELIDLESPVKEDEAKSSSPTTNTTIVKKLFEEQSSGLESREDADSEEDTDFEDENGS